MTAIFFHPNCRGHRRKGSISSGPTEAEAEGVLARQDWPIFQGGGDAFTMKEFISESGTGWSPRHVIDGKMEGIVHGENQKAVRHPLLERILKCSFAADWNFRSIDRCFDCGDSGATVFPLKCPLGTHRVNLSHAEERERPRVPLKERCEMRSFPNAKHYSALRLGNRP